MSVFTWGSCKNGQLGTGELIDVLQPTLLESFRGKRVIDVACGDSHVLAVTELGEAFCWGRNREGQAADETYKQHVAPLPRPIRSLRHQKIIKVASGHYHCLALTFEGQLYQWGKLHRLSEDGQKKYFGTSISLPGLQSMEILERSHRAYYMGDMQEGEGLEDENFKEFNETVTHGDVATGNSLLNFGNFISFHQRTPILVKGLENKKVASMAAGYSFSVCCLEDGSVYAWGINDKQQLGLGHRFNQETPQHIPTLLGQHVVRLACGQQHTLALTSKGLIYSWGLSVFGQLGHGNKVDKSRPTPIMSLINDNVVITSIACGTMHSVAVSDKGKVYTWGNSEYGQMGGGKNYSDWRTGERGSDSHSFYSSPQMMDEEAFEGKKVKDVACGHLHNLALVEDGNCYSWGWGVYGGLGHGDRKFQLLPKMVVKLLDMETSVSKIAAGGKHTVALNALNSSTFAFDFKSAINNARFSDITFVVEGKELYAHKAIVCSRCPGLRAMVVMSERFGFSSDRLELSGKYHVFVALLFYLYTDHLRASYHLLSDLENLSRKWGLPHLEILCRRALINRGTTNVNLPTSSLIVELPRLPPSTLESDFQNLMEDSPWSDISFQVPREKNDALSGPVDYVTVHAHKSVLYSRSEYFRTFFDSSFNHDQKSLKLDGVNLETFLAIMRYIYADQVQGVIDEAEMVVNMLIASDLFLLEDLKQICEDTIERSLDIDNCVWLVDISDRYNAPRLKRACMNMIKRDLDVIKTTGGFTQLHGSHHSLVREIDFELSRENITSPGELIKAIRASVTNVAVN